MLVYLNGDYLDHARAAVSVDDRGFLFGDGVYEVTRARNGRLFEAGRHLRRLARGLKALGIAPPAGFESGGAALVEISDRLLRENGLTSGDALVYLQVTRGAAERTHHFPPAGTPPTVFLRANRLAPPDDVRARGATAITTPDLRWLRCDLKTVQLLPNVLAKEQAVAAGAFEAIFLRDGIVTEGASTNLFAVIGGAVRTHPATERILPGVTREIVLELAVEQGLSVIERPIAIEELPGASELFVTSTSTDVMPVVRLDGRVVGSGRSGPVARQLQAALRERLERDTARAPAV
jgi:D-alanine transaminase